jgi:hypothetical protein
MAISRRTRVAAIALATVLLLVCVELAAAAMYAIRDRIRGADDRLNADALTGIAWKRGYFAELDSFEMSWHPYGYWRGRPTAGEFINIDTDGVRRTWNVPACRTQGGARLPRIFMLGGSTMWGVGARDDYTIPSRLAQMLANDGHPACVVNLGQWGYVNSQELLELLIALRNGERPDVVVFYDGDNDAFSAFQQGVAGLPQNEANRRREFNLQTRPAEMFALATASLLKHSSLLRLADSARERAGKTPVDDPRSLPDAALARAVVTTYQGNLRAIDTLATAYRFQPIFYWQPLVFDKHVQTPYEAARARWDSPFGRFWREVEREVQSEDLAADPRFHNLGDAFAAEMEPIFVDFAHVSEHGNELLASQMSRDVVNALIGAP